MSSGMLRRVALVRIDVSEEPGASFIRVTRICELGTTQAATSNRRTLRSEPKILHIYYIFCRDPYIGNEYRKAEICTREHETCIRTHS
jgi:hypothetical protein